MIEDPVHYEPRPCCGHSRHIQLSSHGNGTKDQWLCLVGCRSKKCNFPRPRRRVVKMAAKKAEDFV